MLPSSVVQSIEKPQKKEIADMFRLEGKLIIDERIGNAQSHAAIVSPYSYLSSPGVKQALIYGILDIVESLVDECIACFDVRLELSAGSKGIANS